MTQTPMWFERKFDFGFGIEIVPTLCNRLRGTPDRLDELLRGKGRDVLAAKPEGKWSAQEHGGHLLDLEALWLARVGDYEAGAIELTAADLTNRRTHDANHNARPLDEILRGFRAEREVLIKRVSGADASLLSRSIPHPRLKTPMRLVDHLYFVAEHDDHHLAQIEGLLADTPVVLKPNSLG
jgi:uncharacterized damage-inducible protein DinB